MIENKRFNNVVRLILPGDNMDIGITKMSSKGQIVIPQDMRDDIKVGEKLVVIKNKDQLILKKAELYSPTIEEDIEAAKLADAAVERYEKNPDSFFEMDGEDFIKEMERW